MKEKVAICTINDNNNYGNRLQNYALQEVIKSLGYEVKTIKNNYTKQEKVIEKIISRDILFKLKRKIKKMVKKDNEENVELKKNNKLRKEKFDSFTKNYILEYEKSIEKKNIESAYNEVNTFVVGSDQVWNYEFSRFSELNFVPYKNESQNLISYAASFGVSFVPNGLKRMYKENLKRFDSISVRELEGKKIVDTLLENNTTKVVLDPTLLLEKEKWEEFSKDSELNIFDDYILTYFLGELSEKDIDYIHKLSDEKKLKILNLNDNNNDLLWTAGPLEFVSLFKNASIVLTDSYHACIFSIIFEKQFEVFERNSNYTSMNSRMVTLFEELSLFNCWHGSNGKTITIDYVKVNKILEMKKKDSLLFLEESLKLYKKDVFK
ncbi:polysaccharide pyruvyl transferase family protein [Vagococcus sp.]|uniref:polysaccharide pyruvyl transferase family protein n=1 Tax=Vagococcus sp. TaxID=1933889 RepID=UPI003F9BCCFC